MSPRIVGPSGIELEVDSGMARGLVRDGFATLAEGESETVLDRPDPAVVILNPEVSPGVVLPVGNSVSDVAGQPAVDGKPRGNASREEWVAYALANGKTEDDLIGLKQGEIRELFATPPAETEADGGTPPATDADPEAEQTPPGDPESPVNAPEGEETK